VNWLCRIAVTIWAFAAVAASAQPPTELDKCLSRSGDDPTCTDIGGPITFTECNQRFENFFGRIAWYPLQCIGPITISIETYAHWETRFPLYVEVVPLRDPTEVCENSPGFVVLVARGSGDPCGTSETAGPMDITSVAPIGTSYAIRVFFLGHPTGDSTAMDCIRVTAQPVASPIDQHTWASVKTIYR